MSHARGHKEAEKECVKLRGDWGGSPLGGTRMLQDATVKRWKVAVERNVGRVVTPSTGMAKWEL